MVAGQTTVEAGIRGAGPATPLVAVGEVFAPLLLHGTKVEEHHPLRLTEDSIAS